MMYEFKLYSEYHLLRNVVHILLTIIIPAVNFQCYVTNDQRED
jgi:hypothetical protein